MTEIAVRPAETIGAFDPADQQLLKYLGLNPQDPRSAAVVAVARRYNLDPLLKHVVVIPNGGVYITRDGLLHTAHDSGQLDGIVVELEPTLSEDKTEWTARVTVWRKDMRHPFTFPGRYPAKGGNTRYAQEMALKAAEAHALRRAFDVSGLPTEDEQRPPFDETGQRRMTAETILEPEPTQQASAAVPVTRDQLTKMHTLFNTIGWTDRDDKLRACSIMAGRPLETSTAMSKVTASRIIDILEAISQDGDPAGALTLYLAEQKERDEREQRDIEDADLVDDSEGGE